MCEIIMLELRYGTGAFLTVAPSFQNCLKQNTTAALHRSQVAQNPAQCCFSGSVKCWASLIGNGFQVTIFKIEDQRT